MIRFYFLIEFFLCRYLNCHWIDTVLYGELRGTTVSKTKGTKKFKIYFPNPRFE